MTNDSDAGVLSSPKAASSGRVLVGDVLVTGTAQAEKIVLGKPLSFWGGYDSDAGKIIDRTHPQVGDSLAGKIMVMAHAKGSSSSSSVLAEAIRNGTGPVGIVLRERDLIISIGAIVAAELYNLDVPVVCLEPSAFDKVVSAPGPLRIEASGGQDGAKVYLDCR
ncbi:aconitase X swivel domain-containing protein [Paraburkholderia sp. SIMBA_030]|uniref:aconitase X swivel domain-containing protein n=1 Tax=Paraburkholderia sp. SIMBA_030 TaxID=3085773 RepID=UPI00397C52DE